MKIKELMPTWDFSTETYCTADIWKQNQNGVNRRMMANYGQSPWLLVLPDFVPRKYKNRKIRSVLVQIDDLENVILIDAHYGHYSADGYTVRHSFDFFGARSESDVTAAYRV